MCFSDEVVFGVDVSHIIQKWEEGRKKTWNSIR